MQLARPGGGHRWATVRVPAGGLRRLPDSSTTAVLLGAALGGIEMFRRLTHRT